MADPTPTPTLVERAREAIAELRCRSCHEPVLFAYDCCQRDAEARIADHVRSERARFARELAEQVDVTPNDPFAAKHVANWLRAAAEREEAGHD